MKTENATLSELIDQALKLAQHPRSNAVEIAEIRAQIEKKIRLLESYVQPRK